MPKRTTADTTPTGLQNFVEMSIEFVEDNVQSLFGSIKNKLLHPCIDGFCLDLVNEFNGFNSS